jgi:glycerophosphoryl diester phosphodiesterase
MAHADGPQYLIAHRGVGSNAYQAELNIPENSLRAWKWALANGADIADLDVQVTRDGKFVVMHDDTIDRTTNKSGEVRNLTASTIMSAYLELPEDTNHNNDPDNTKDHPPSADQALALLNDYPNRITLELKGNASMWTKSKVNEFRNVLRDRKLLTDQVIVHSFSETVMGYAKQAGIPARGVCVSKAGHIHTPAEVLALGQYVCISYSRATPQLVTSYRSAGIGVIIWTMDTKVEYEKAWALGPVYGWMVNELLEVQGWLKAKR